MLYLISTPIGNLGDISQRALDTFKECDLVVSEDTRKTGFLLNHFGIKKPQFSFREDNEQKALPKVMNELASGKTIGLVTDAGTPAISDPGFILVRAALAAEIPVSAIPGPTALIMAVVVQVIMQFLVGAVDADRLAPERIPQLDEQEAAAWFQSAPAEHDPFSFQR